MSRIPCTNCTCSKVTYFLVSMSCWNVLQSPGVLKSVYSRQDDRIYILPAHTTSAVDSGSVKKNTIYSSRQHFYLALVRYCYYLISSQSNTIILSHELGETKAKQQLWSTDLSSQTKKVQTKYTKNKNMWIEG